MPAHTASEVHNLLMALRMDRFNIGDFRHVRAVANRAGSQVCDAGVVKNITHPNRLPIPLDALQCLAFVAAVETRAS